MSFSLEDIFKVEEYSFPYLYIFPGQEDNEVVLFATRKHKVFLYIKLFTILLISMIIVLLSYSMTGLIKRMFSSFPAESISLFLTAIAAIILFVGFWWVRAVWKKSILIITNKRILKFNYSNPFKKNTLSIDLGEIRKLGTQKNDILKFLNIGTLVINDNYIKRVLATKEIKIYLNSLLKEYKNDPRDLIYFRPYLPKLSAYQREEIMKKYPEYWS